MAEENATALMFRALAFAAGRHRDQRRKGQAGAPYINHPIDVVALLAGPGEVTDPLVLAAALLHDTIEDTGTSAADLKERFGEEVTGVVLELTDDKSLPREDRMRHQLRRAGSYSLAAKMVRIADKISNLIDVTEDPPENWSRQRRRDYIEWAGQVVEKCRGVNRGLEQRFDEVLQSAREALGREDGRPGA